MADLSVTLYPGDTLTITASDGQEPDPPAAVVPAAAAPAPTIDAVIAAADAAAADAGSADPAPADSPAGVVAEPASIQSVGAS